MTLTKPITLFLLFLIGALLEPPIRGDETALASSATANATTAAPGQGLPEAVRYRYWYVPHQQPEVWPLGSDSRYTPMARRDFEAWIAHLTALEQETTTTTPTLRHAHYTASLEGNALVGRATLTPSSRTRLPLSSLPPITGFWFRADAASRAAVRGAWSLRGTENGSCTLTFPLRFPASVSTQIELTLPAMWRPAVSSGFVVGPTETPVADAERPEALSQWIVFLGNRADATLTLTRPQSGAVTRQQVGAVETILWNVTPQAMQLTSKLTFDATDTPPQTFFLDLSPSLHILEIKCDGIVVPRTQVAVDSVATADATAVATADASQVPLPKNRVLVRLPNRTRTELTEIEITAESPLPRTEENATTASLWELPRVTLVSPSLFVRESRGTLLVWRPLFTRDIAITRGTQTAPVGLIDRPDRDVFAFQFFDTTASISVRLDQQCSGFQWNSGTQVFWNGPEIVASMTVDVAASEGSVYLLEFPIRGPWNIESVRWATVPEPVSWSVRHDMANPTPSETPSDTPNNTPSNETAATAPRTLEVKLATPLEVNGMPRRLRIEGRHTGSATSSLESLVPTVLPQPLSGEHCISVETPETYRLQWNLLQFPKRQVLDSASSTVERRFSESPEGTLFPLQRATTGLDLTLVPQRPALAVTTESHVVLRDQEMQQVHSFRCRPSGSTIDSVTIAFAADTSAAVWGWRLRDETEQPQIIRTSGGVSVWEIRFANPRSAAFEVIASRTVPASSGMPIPLPSVLSATEQQAELFIESVELVRFRIDNTRLEMMAPPAPPLGEFSSVRSVLRYVPDQEFRATDPAVRLMDIESDAVLPAAWVWASRLHSQFEASGVVRNKAMFRIENRGVAELEITFPRGVTSDDIRTVGVGDGRIAWLPKSGAGPLVVSVPLPERQRFVTVLVEFTLQDRPLAQRRKLAPETPSVNIPVLNAQWIAWIPPDFVVSHKTTRIGAGIQGIDFFLTPLSGRGARPFDPLTFLTWNYWRPRPTPEAESQEAAREFLAVLDKTLQHLRATTPHTATWGDLLRNAVATMSEMRSSRPVEVFIDRTSLAGWNVFPTTPLPDATTASGTTASNAAALLDAAGLVVLSEGSETPGGQRASKLYLTTFLNLACHRDEVVSAVGETLWGLRDGTQEVAPGSGLDRRIESSWSRDAETQPLLPITAQLAWITAQRWSNETTPTRSPWGANLHEREFIAVTPTWNAHPSLTTSRYPSLYVVQRDSIVAWGWLLFLAVIVLTQVRPMSHPVFLLLLIVQAEVVLRNITLCYAPLPTGVLLGGVFSLAFSLVRLTTAPQRYRLRRRDDAMSSLVANELNKQSDASESEPGETRIPISQRSTETMAPVTQQRVATLAETEFDLNESLFDPETYRRFLARSFVVLALASAAVAVLLAPPLARGDLAAPRDDRPWLTSTRHEPYRVLIPVDEGQRIVGETVWLSTEFYSRLTGSAARSRPTDEGAIITRAAYSGTLDAHPLTQVVTLPTLTATFTVELKRSSATILLPPLPLAPSETTTRTITWDRAAIAPRLLGPGHGIEITVESQSLGMHELEIILTPSVEAMGDLRQCGLAIPPIADTTLTLRFPNDIATPQIGESLGRITTGLTPQQPLPTQAAIPSSPTTPTAPTAEVSSGAGAGMMEWTAEVGPVSTLAFSWFQQRPKGDEAVVEVDQLQWLWCRAHQTNLRVQWEFRVSAGTIAQIQVLTDPRFRLSGQYHCYHVPERHLAASETFPDEPTEIPITSLEAILLASNIAPPQFGEGMQATALHLATAVSGTILVRADFVLRHFGGIGQIPFPHVVPISGRLARSLIATSGEPSLELRTTGTEAEQSGTSPDDFKASWERFRPRLTLPDTIDRAFALTVPPRDWVLSIEMRPPTKTATLTESFALSTKTAEILFEATMTPSREIFSQTLSVPAAMEVDQIELLDAVGQRLEFRRVTTTPTPASKDREWIHLFFKRPLAGAATIRVRGAVPIVPESGLATPLPRVELVGATTTSAMLSLYRSSDLIVNLEVDETEWMSIDPASTSPFGLAEMIFVGRYVTPALPATPATTTTTTTTSETARHASATTPLFTVTPNAPQIRGRIVETLRHLAASETWSVQWEITLDLTGGELALLPIVLDAQTTGALSVEPSSVRIADDTTIDGVRRVVLVLREAVSGHFSLTLTSAIRPSDKEIPVPPLTIDRPCVALERFLAVPMFAKGAIQWELTGGVPADSESAVHREMTRPGEQLFVLQSENYSGRGTVMGSGGTIRLLDVRFFVRNDGEFFAFATCDAEGGLGRRIVVSLPPTTPLIEVSASGITVPIPHDQRHRLSLIVGAYPMPQRLDIVYRGRIDRWARDGHDIAVCDLPIPKLDGITVQETLWSVALETEHGLHSPMNVRCGDETTTASYEIVAPRDTTALLGTLAAVRLERMLVSLEQVPKETPRESVNVRRWFSLWERQWNEQTLFIDRLLGDEPELATTATLARTLFAGDASTAGETGSAASFVRSVRSLDDARRILQTRFRKWLTAFEGNQAATPGGSIPATTALSSTPPVSNDAASETLPLMWLARERTSGWGPLTSIESWSDRNHSGTAFFAGVSRGGLGRLQLVIASPPSHRWGAASRMTLVWLALMVFTLALPLSASLRETIASMPHFWSVCLGVVLWTLSPTGTLGLAWIALTVATLAVPLWRRRFRKPHAGFVPR